MSEHYPVKFTLEDGVHVEVIPTGVDTYAFTLNGKDGSQQNFTLFNSLPKEEIEASLSFDQLNAVRRFWLEKEMMS